MRLFCDAAVDKLPLAGVDVPRELKKGLGPAIGSGTPVLADSRRPASRVDHISEQPELEICFFLFLASNLRPYFSVLSRENYVYPCANFCHLKDLF